MIIIIGAGITGLTVARELRSPFLLLERADRPGGLAGEYDAGGYSFPYGGHYFHFQGKEHLLSRLRCVSGFSEFQRNSQVFLQNRFIPFPIQYHLSFLDRRDRERILEETASSPSAAAEHLEGFLRAHFGEHLCRLFFTPFLEKYYRTDLTQIEAQMDRGSIPIPDRGQMIRGARGERFRDAGYNPRFFYPRHYSLNRFIAAYAEPVQSSLKTLEEVRSVDLAAKTVTTDRGRYPYSRLVSTIPLNQFLRLTGDPQWIARASALQHISTLVCNGVLASRRRRFHWLYIPENRFPWYRIGYYPSRNTTRFYAEMTVAGERLPEAGELAERVAELLTETGMIRRRSEILFLDNRSIPVSYILFERMWKQSVPPLRSDLAAIGVHTIGRYGSWGYSSMTDDMESALATAAILNGS